MTALLLAAQLAAAVPCTTVQPSPAFVCHNGQWLPPNHPLLPPPSVVEPPPPVSGTPRFHVGRRYLRQTATSPYEAGPPTDLFISGAGQLVDGTPVLFATCLAVGDGCFAVNYVRVLPIAANAADFTEMPLP